MGELPALTLGFQIQVHRRLEFCTFPFLFRLEEGPQPWLTPPQLPQLVSGLHLGLLGSCMVQTSSDSSWEGATGP